MKKTIAKTMGKAHAKNNRSIALIGFMGTGKTTTGALLAKQLEFQFLDTDAIIEDCQGQNIAQIFNENGEAYFRKLETETLKRLLLNDRQIIATGGGIILSEENRRLLKTHSYLVCLTASPELIYERTKEETTRPLLLSPDPKAQIKKLLADRQEYYQIAQLTINTNELDPDEICKKILFNYRQS